MDFALDARTLELREQLTAFMDEHVYPAESVYREQMRASGDANHHPQVLEDLKAEARSQGLWNLFHPHPEWGPGLTNLEYAHLAEITGRSIEIAPEAINCNAPDTGNMEVLTLFGTDEHKERWLGPLLTGEVRSAFAMTEPAVASSDATNIETSMVRDGDEYVINGEKIYVTAGSRATHIVVWATLDKSQGRAAIKSFIVPREHPGVTVERLEHKLGIKASDTAAIRFVDARIPKENLLGSPEIKTDKGFAGVMQTFDNTRPIVAAMAVGVNPSSGRLDASPSAASLSARAARPQNSSTS